MLNKKIRHQWIESAIVTVTACLVLGCGGNQPRYRQDEITAYERSQSQWMASLYRGMPVDHALRPVASFQQYYFQYQENDAVYRYHQGRHPGTDTLFALLFEDDNLISLLTDQAVTDFAGCRVAAAKSRANWPVRRFQKTVDWIKQRDQIGVEYAMSPNVRSNRNKPGISGGEAVEIVTHLPLAIIALPFYGMYKASGMENRELSDMESRISSLRLRATTQDEIVDIFGIPDHQIELSSQAAYWTYRSDNLVIGFENRIVVWRESVFWHIPENHSAFYRDSDCSSVTH